MFEKSKELFDECIKELDCKWNNRVTLTESIYCDINNNIDSENTRLIIETNCNRFEKINEIARLLASSVLQAVELTSGYDYVYLEELIRNNKPVFKLSINKPDTTLDLPDIFLATKKNNYDSAYGAYDPTSDGIIINILDDNGRIPLSEIYDRIFNNIFLENLAHEISYWMQGKIKKKKNIPWKNINYNTPKQYYTNKLEADAFRNEAMLMVQSFFPSLMIRYILSNDDPNVELKELVNNVINYILSHVLAKNPSLKNFINYTSEKELKKLKKDVCEYSKRVFFCKFRITNRII